MGEILKHRKGKIMKNMTNAELISALNALGALPVNDVAKIADEKRKQAQDARMEMRACDNKTRFAKSHNKWWLRDFSLATNQTYNQITEALSSLIPAQTEEDGQIGKTFYISTDKQRGEFISIHVSRTNGVSTCSGAILDSVEKAQEYDRLLDTENEMRKLMWNAGKLASLAKQLSGILIALENLSEE